MTSTGTGAAERVSTAPGTSSRPHWQRAYDLLVGSDDRPATSPPRLKLLTVALIAGLLAVWRGAILLVSYFWGRMGVIEPWPEDIDVMWLWRYSVRWDSGWYLSIARDGYFHNPEGQSSIAFFPMFPHLIRFAEQVLPGSEVFAGLIIVHLALFAALIYIYQLVRIDFPQVVAWRTLFFTLIFPASFFFSALYTESLLLLGFAGTLYHARRGQWLFAALFGVFTGLTKLIGIVLVVPVALEMLRQKAVTRENLRPILYTAITPIGAIGYLTYLHLEYGDFRVYFDAQAYWFRESFSPQPFSLLLNVMTGNPPEIFPYPANITPIHDLFLYADMFSLILFITAGVYIWLRIRPSYGAMVLAGAMVPALSGTPLALMRYMAILFPVFILVARIESEAVRNIIAIISALLLAFVTYLFVNGYWAG